MRQSILNGLLSATLIGSLCSLHSLSGAETPRALKPGDKAPLIEGQDQDGHPWKLQDALGKQAVLLYFYPKDDTPGCTKEACGFRDRISNLKQDHVQVVGVSFDSATSHQDFIKKYQLNFPLLADTDGKIADAYGVRIPGKSMAHRISFLIDKNGVIRHITDNPAADVHLTEMKEAVASLGSSGS